MFHDSQKKKSGLTQNGARMVAPGRRRGFTLIEAVVAIVVLSIAIPPMIWSIRESHIQRASPMMASLARWLASEKIEDIIADRHSTTRGYTYVTNANYAAEPNVAGFPAFSRSVNIAETEVDLVTPGTGYKVVTVTVSWTDAESVARSLDIQTVIADYT